MSVSVGIHLQEATTEPLQDLTQSSVQRLTSTEDTELQHNTHISDPNQMSNYKHYFPFYIARHNPETHRTEADSRRQPDSAGSTRHGRSMHHIQNESQDNTQQTYKNMILYYIITQIEQTLKPERSAERQSETKDRLHSAVHQSTALRGMRSDTRLTIALLETTCEIHRQCIIIIMQRGQTRFIYSLTKGAERQQ